jgi:putative transposase
VPPGNPVHGLLDWKRAAIIGLFQAWGQIDPSHRKLAHGGSRLPLGHVSESTAHRVLAEEGLVIESPWDWATSC